MQQEQQKFVGDCLLYFFIIYCAILHFISTSFLDRLDENELPIKKQEEYKLTTEIVVIDAKQRCPNFYTPLITFEENVQNLNYYNKYYTDDSDNILKPQRKAFLDNGNSQSEQEQAFSIKNNNQINCVSSFKICGQKEKVEKVFRNQDNTDNNSITNPNDINNEVNNGTNSQRLLLKESTTSLKREICLKRQKTCRYKDSSYCVKKDAKCPVSRFHIELSSNEIQSNEGTSDREVFDIGNDLLMVVERESNEYSPIVELIASSSDEKCINSSQEQLYESQLQSNHKHCKYMNNSHRQVLSADLLISMKQFYQLNGMNIQDDESTAELERRKLALFAKHIDFSEVNQYSCISDIEYFEINKEYSSIKSYADFLNFLTLAIIICILLTLIATKPQRIIEIYFNPITLYNIFLLATLFIYLCTLWILLMIKFKFSEVWDDLTNISKRECLDTSIGSNIRKYFARNSGEIQLGFLIAFSFLPLVAYIGIKLVKRFCWMRTANSVMLVPQNGIELQTRRRRQVNR